MKRIRILLMIVLAVSGLQLAACSPKAAVSEVVPPVRVEHLTGSKQVTRVTLTADAAKRLDLRTEAVQVETVGGVQHTMIPYASILYDTTGATWVYTSPAPLTYLRTPVEVDEIDGDRAIIQPGLEAGVQVVTTGAEELFGSETEFEEE